MSMITKVAGFKDRREERERERSLRTLPPTYTLSLVFSHGNKYCDQTFCTLFDESYHVTSVPEMRRMRCIISCYGWLMLKSIYSTESETPHQCYLFNPVSLTKIHLPPLPSHRGFNKGVLTSSPTDHPNCVVMLFSSIRKSLIFFRIGGTGTKWVEQYFKPRKERRNRRRRNKYIVITKNEEDLSAISCKGKIYLLFFQGMAIISEIHDTFVCMELYNVKHPNFTLSRGTFLTRYRDYLVESCGEIFRVCQILFGLEHHIVQTFDVFKLDLSTMSWVKVESLGDNRIFLLGESLSISISATQAGLKGNCIYFYFPKTGTSLYKYDMDDRTITITTPPGLKKIHNWKGPFWMVPDCKLQVKKNTAKVNDFLKKDDEWNCLERSWKDLPTELLEMILSFLFLGDCIRFRLTSKSWMSITPLLQSNNLHIQPELAGVYLLPWLMCFPKKNQGACKFYHPIYSDSYAINIPELAGAIIHNARYGWLLMSRQDTFIFFFNPFTLEIINLPDLGQTKHIQSMSFCSPPTSSDFIVIGMVVPLGMLIVYRKSEDTWRCYPLKNYTSYEFVFSACNPIFYGGVFCFLCKDGNLVLFNPKVTDHEEDEMIVFLESKVFSITSWNSDGMKSIRNFIVEYDGEILSVFVGHRGKPLWVFKLDMLTMKWNRLETLGDKVLFLSHTGSILVPAPLKGVENRIYFPRFQGKDIMFYSLSTCKFHCFGCNNPADDWLNTTEHMECTWI